MSDWPTCPNCKQIIRSVSDDPYCWDCASRFSDLTKPLKTSQGTKLPKDPRLEKEIQQAIRRAWEALGYEVWNVSQPRATKQHLGLPDQIVVGHGRIIWNEIKRPNGKLSSHQEHVREQVTLNGGTYLVMRHEDEVQPWHESHD